MLEQDLNLEKPLKILRVENPSNPSSLASNSNETNQRLLQQRLAATATAAAVGRNIELFANENIDSKFNILLLDVLFNF